MIGFLFPIPPSPFFLLPCSAQTPATKDGYHVLRTLLIRCGEKKPDCFGFALLLFVKRSGKTAPRKDMVSSFQR